MLPFFNNTLQHVQTPTFVEEITTRYAVEMTKGVTGSLKTMYWFIDEKHIGMLAGWLSTKISRILGWRELIGIPL